MIGVKHLHCCHHWCRHAACSVAWAVLHAILEETKGAIVKVQQHAHTIALLVFACRIVVPLAVAEEGSIISADAPAISAVKAGIKVGPADADEDLANIF